MMFLGLALTGCEPMEDIHDEVDTAIGEPNVQGAVNYTLTEEDYTDPVTAGGLGLSFPNFSSVDEAKSLIPVILNRDYPMWGEGSLVNATFNLYDPIRIHEVTMTEEDYADLNLSDNYITDFYQLQNFVSSEFPQAGEGDFVEVTYNKIAEEIAYTLTDSDFEVIETELSAAYPGPAENAGSFGSFDVRDWSDNYWNDDMILEAINVVLSEEFDDIPGQTYNVSYDVYYPATLSMSVAFNGNEYVRIGGMAYDVSNDDFDLIEAEFASVYPDPAESAAQYNNFERRSTSDAYWSDAMILEALDFLLKEKLPNATEGEEYDVTYRTYSGSAGSEIISLVFENGNWVPNTNATIYTVKESTVLAYANNRWAMPISLEREDYTAMGQSYPNFSDEDEAIYKIGIWLGLEYPYAEEGDFAAISYDLFSGGVSTEYANYFFNGDEWEYIPSVVEQSLQFGLEDGAWAPDNTKTYTLTQADYAFIGAEFADVYEDPAWSVGRYNNFDTRSGNRNQWDDAMLLEAMNVLLNERVAPNAEDGQKYVVTFNIYDGSAGTRSLNLIYQDGAWMLNE